MEIQARATDWSTNDEENLAKFLETETGKRLIPRLVVEMPSLLPGGESNAILIRSGEVRAWQGFMEALVVLAHPPKPTAPPNANEYPPLEHDAAWNDGQRLDPSSKTETLNS